MSQNQIDIQECPICFDPIEQNKNCVTTDCGHTFHCSCLMKNAINNGFGCPMCRQQMAEDPEEPEEEDEEDDDDEESYESWNQVWSQLQEDNALTSFRMFQQRLENEEVEEEPLEPHEDQDQVQVQAEMPTPEYLAEKLAEKGITMIDMIKPLLLEHQEYDQDFDIFERRTSELYGEIRRLILHYND